MKDNLHDVIVRELYNRPAVYLGIERNSIIAKNYEYEMYKHGRLYVVPDLFFETELGLHFYEVKSSCSKNCKQKGMLQMHRMENWLREHMPESVDTATIGLIMPTKKYKSLDKILDNLTISYH